MTTRDHCANCGRPIVLTTLVNCGGDILFSSAPEYRVWLHVDSGRTACWRPWQLAAPPKNNEVATPRRTVGDSADLDARDAGQRAADEAR